MPLISKNPSIWAGVSERKLKTGIRGRGGSFVSRQQKPDTEAVRKVLYLAIERISKRWKRPIKDWVAALNHFSVVFEGRVPE
jgi:hypothetical protein